MMMICSDKRTKNMTRNEQEYPTVVLSVTLVSYPRPHRLTSAPRERACENRFISTLGSRACDRGGAACSR